MEIKEMVLRLADAAGVSGAEAPAAQVAAELLSPLGQVETTPLGSVVCRINPPKEGGRHYLLDAHLDEIGMIVTYITDEGFLRVGNVGGLDRRLLMAGEVLVHTADGPLYGVICSVPPHLQGGEAKNPKVEEIAIDIGLDKEEAGRRVCFGDRVTFSIKGRALLGRAVTGKALDDRAGCAAVLRAAELLQGGRLGCGVTLVLSSQEEVGGIGARTAAFAVAPTHCITVDVSFAHTPDTPRYKCGELGKGPMIGFSPVLDQQMGRELVQIAKEQGIPYQCEVMGGATGTNADDIACSGAGVRTALLSVPQQYMHTPVEKVDLRDIEDTARLIAAYIKAKEEETSC